MNVFEAVKPNISTRQAAEMYGIKVNRNGMAVCPFHNDKNPSMKVDKRFHCFACQADGDVIDFVSRLCGLPCKEAAMKLADDFGISYDSRHKPTVRPHIREPTAEQLYQKVVAGFVQDGITVICLNSGIVERQGSGVGVEIHLAAHSVNLGEVKIFLVFCLGSRNIPRGL